MTDVAPDGPPGGPPDGGPADRLAACRARIDAIDLALVALLNERAACAAEIGRIKHDAGIPVYAPRREEEVLRNVTSANAGPLSPEAVRHLFERVIDETRSLERELFERDAANDGPTEPRSDGERSSATPGAEAL